jgi:hypothetical protein
MNIRCSGRSRNFRRELIIDRDSLIEEMRLREKLQVEMEQFRKEASEKQKIEEENNQLKAALESLTQEKDALLAEVVSLRSASLSSSTQLSGSNISDLASPMFARETSGDLKLELIPVLQVQLNASAEIKTIDQDSALNLSKEPQILHINPAKEELEIVTRYSPEPIQPRLQTKNLFDLL